MDVGIGMLMDFKILTEKLLEGYTKAVKESPSGKIDKSKKLEMPVDYFQFYKSVSSVYSSKIEGEDIDFDSYFKHKFLKVKFKPDYTRKADDLYGAYDFIDNNNLTLVCFKTSIVTIVCIMARFPLNGLLK